jgi:hypothetical protein
MLDKQSVAARQHLRKIIHSRRAREKNLTFPRNRWGAAMYGRRPPCKGKESDLSRNDTGAVMYPASKVQPFWLRALM